MSAHDEMNEAAIDVEVSEKSKALANVDPGQQMAGTLLQAINGGKPYFWTSLQPKTHEDRLNNVRLLSSSSNDIEEILAPKSFTVQDIIISKATFTDKEGEMVMVPKLVLIDAKGKGITIMAKVWVTQFLNVMAMCGLPPWKPGIKVAAKSEKGNGANKYYSLVLP